MGSEGVRNPYRKQRRKCAEPGTSPQPMPRLNALPMAKPGTKRQGSAEAESPWYAHTVQWAERPTITPQ